MPYEITGSFRRDEDEVRQLSGVAEVEAMDRVRPPRPPPKKPDPFTDVETPRKRGKPDPFTDVDLPRKRPNPFSD
jgi:hypothetical protein